MVTLVWYFSSTDDHLKYYDYTAVSVNIEKYYLKIPIYHLQYLFKIFYHF